MTKVRFAALLLCAVSALGCEVSAPAVCGNGRAEGAEVCDREDLAGATCESMGGGPGTLGCQRGCGALDLTYCGAPASCGNGALDGAEPCDGALLGAASCESLGFAAGELQCLDNCLAFDTTSCGAPLGCGNGQLDAGEVCDGALLGGSTCEALSHGPGTLQCAADCRGFDTSTCGECAPDCSGRECGFDARCGVSCGTCSPGACEAGMCVLELGARFAATHSEWSTPPGGVAGVNVNGLYLPAGGDWDPGQQHWSTFDIDGDRRPDLVVTAISGEQPGLGVSPHWLVHRNNGSGFDAAPIRWSTPDGGVAGVNVNGLYLPAGGDWDPGQQHWSTFDIDGDGRPDLVVTAQSGEQPGLGVSPHWLVHRNNGSGFDAGAIQWATPDGGVAGVNVNGLYLPAGGDWDPGQQHWSTFDIDGDARPDLVVTAQSGEQPGLGADPHWLVYRNNGGGFDASPTQWSTPDGGVAGVNVNGLYLPAGGDWDPGQQHWSTFDIDGDARPDLVVSAESGEQPGLGVDPHWWVHRNNGSGFDAAAIAWSTPDGGVAGVNVNGFYLPAGGDWDPGLQHWSTFDIDGDARPDLVVTAQSGEQPGLGVNPHWWVYRNNGSGFDASSVEWLTPDAGVAGVNVNGLYLPAGGDWDPGQHHWSTFDIDGDTRPDLVVTAQSGDQFGLGGDAHWRVYLNTAAAD